MEKSAAEKSVNNWNIYQEGSFEDNHGKNVTKS